jgi:AbrB family looped-hinge helix DNA binding protein
MTATVSSKGQITIPRFIREALGLDKGSAVNLELVRGELRLIPASSRKAGRLAGSLSRYAKSGKGRAVRGRVKKGVARAAAAEGIAD